MSDVTLTFEHMNFDEKLLQSIKLQKFETPTEIQKQAIPIIMQGHDLLATAKTGSGKTLAFVTPALHLLTKEPVHKSGRGPRVVILSPTRELANQIADCTKPLSKKLPYKYGIITGGVPYFNQEKMLKDTLDFLIATPGRLIDHAQQGKVDFSRVELFILDEADRMLDMGFRKDIEFILSSIPSQRQILLFSATFEGDLKTIANRFLKQPKRLELSPERGSHDLITQHIYPANDNRHKNELLHHLLEAPGIWQAIVFTRTKRGAERLADDLFANKIHCAALHGDMKQSKRTQTLARLHRGELKALIATDVAARGIDVKGLSHVINYDLPPNPDDYVHRIGRTGRCGENGTAISFVCPEDWSVLAQIERRTGQRLERKTIPGLEPMRLEPKSKPKANQRNERRFTSRNEGQRPKFRNGDQKSNRSSNKSNHFNKRNDKSNDSNARFKSRDRSDFNRSDRSDSNGKSKSEFKFKPKSDAKFKSRSEFKSGSGSRTKPGFSSTDKFKPKGKFKSKTNVR